MSFTIAVLDVIPPERAERMRALLPEGFALIHGVEPGLGALKALIARADFAIAGQVAVPAEALRAATRLKLLHKWGVGVDNIDVEAARALGVRVARTTGSNALSVAEFTIGLMIGALRFIPFGHHMLQQGVWRGPSHLPGPARQLTGKTVGIVGLGAIGRNVARLLGGFSCTTLYTQRTALPRDEEERLGVRHAPLPEMLETADILTLHCPLTPQTEGLIDKGALARMKRTALLVNTARGGVVVERDLIEALRDGVIAGAAMDVFAQEPLPADSPLIGLDNLLMTPHLASANAENFEPTVRRMFANIARVARGEEPAAGDVVA